MCVCVMTCGAALLLEAIVPATYQQAASMMETPPVGGTTSRLTAAGAGDSVAAVLYIANSRR